jgi:hypothetical protein
LPEHVDSEPEEEEQSRARLFDNPELPSAQRQRLDSPGNSSSEPAREHTPSRPGTPVLVPEAPADASGRSANVSLGEVSADVGMRGYSASAPSGAVRTGSEVGAVPLSL